MTLRKRARRNRRAHNSPTQESAEPSFDSSPLFTYLQAIRTAGSEDVHEALAHTGTEILKHGVPYLVTAARWRAKDHFRRDARRQELLDRDKQSYEMDLASSQSWDPYEWAVRSESSRRLLKLLGELPNRELLTVWGHARGSSNEEILADWVTHGLEQEGDSPDTVERVRQAAIARLRRRVKGAGQEKT
jgi:hypothetical protein